MSFNLETAISAWRHQFKYQRFMLEDDLDELERHLRDVTKEHEEKGLHEEAAFRVAMKSLGDFSGTDVEYRKVYWGKLKRRHQMLNEVSWAISMLKNYLLIAYRVVTKEKLYSGLNVIGLGVGLAAFILIASFIRREIGFDTFHEDADQIYRVILQQNSEYQGTNLMASSPASLASMLEDELPDVVSATTLFSHTALLGHGDEHYAGDGFKVDDDFLSVFSFPLLRGNRETALIESYSIVLTASLAETIFGDADPVGETLLLDDGENYTVTGVLEDVPDISHFTFTFVTSIVSEEYYTAMLAAYTLTESNFFTYFRIAKDLPLEVLQEQVEALTQKNQAERDLVDREHFIVQSLLGIHLTSRANFELGTNGDIRLIYLLGVIALTVLLLACSNYMNLAIARSVKRAREVGMRKVIGASRRQLVFQFIGESTLLSLIALGLALVIVWLSLPAFSSFVETDITPGFAGNPVLPGLLILLALGVGVISGSYPALFMSSLRPARVLKGEIPGRRPGRIPLRTFLIVGQFAISFILVIGSLIVFQQLRFIHDMDTGYNRDQVLAIPAQGGKLGAEINMLNVEFNTLKNELLQNPSILSVASSRHQLLDITSGRVVRGWEGSADGAELRVNYTNVGYDFFDLYGITVIEGRSFSTDFETDEVDALLLNEAAAAALGWSDPIGKRLHVSLRTGTVVGVVGDFHYRTLHQAIEPLVIRLDTDRLGFINVKIGADNIRESIAYIRKKFEAVSSYPFEYNFMDEVFNRQYQAEINQGRLLNLFTFLALVIAALGLFGLAAISAEQRTKELGVRKVLGASGTSLVVLLSRDFIRLVIVAFILAAPVVYLAANDWLDSFVYRVEIGPGVFAVALTTVIMVAWFSVTYQALRAARTNPVRSLQSD